MGKFVDLEKCIIHFFPPFRKFVTFSSLGNHGRFGNQLFQYSAVRAYSLKNNIPLILPFNKYHDLGKLNINANLAPLEKLKKVKREIYMEEGFHFNENFFKNVPRIDFHGFFQSYKYFSDYRELLIQELKIKNSKSFNYCKGYINKIRKKNPKIPIVALHNRRGDNVPHKEKYFDKKMGVFRPDKDNFHPLPSIEYFNRAKLYFPNAVFVVFSDNQKDINWCKKHINGEMHYYSEGHDKYEDFTLMQLCNHNIISNSSFSWWAAYLNNNPDKTVIAPKTWFGKEYSHYDMSDFFPKEWIVI